jgi:hypothetical protein
MSHEISNDNEILSDENIKDLILFNYSRFVNEMNHTEDLCLKAVKCYGSVLQHLKLQTSLICKEAIKNTPNSFEFVINKNFDICKFALEIDGLLIRFISSNYLNSLDNESKNILILTALNQNSIAIQYIEQTPLYCKIAYDNNPNSLEFIKLNIKNFYTESLPPNDNCAICLSDDNETWCQLNCCTHKYHINCINKVKKNECPQCRNNFIIEFIS